jgi:uncharacterized membrane protein
MYINDTIVLSKERGTMYQTLTSSLADWNDTTSDRQKLQHGYIIVAVILLIIAGVLGLLNQALGQQILAIAIAAAAVFLVNAIAWALLQSFVLMHVANKQKVTRSPRKK